MDRYNRPRRRDDYRERYDEDEEEIEETPHRGYAYGQQQSEFQQGNRRNYGYGQQRRPDESKVRRGFAYGQQRREYEPEAERGFAYGQQHEDFLGDEQRTQRHQQEQSHAWDIPGPYAGHGPQGFRRSDERILEEVCERLTRHGRIDARQVAIQVQNGEVTLQGSVENRQMRRLVEETVERVPGVQEIHNQLQLSPHAEQSRERGA